MIRSSIRAVLALTLLLSAPAITIAAQSPAGTTTIILVRHAEKAAEPAADPPLTSAGVARAEALAEMLKGAGVQAIVSTQFQRTRSTAAPAAARLGLTTEILDARLPARATVDSIFAKHRGQTILVVGHSNTVPGIVAALGAMAQPAICDTEYDNVYIVTLPATGAAAVVRAKYGVPTPVEAGCR
jgi:broad specificity phosphatase PhoE